MLLTSTHWNVEYMNFPTKMRILEKEGYISNDLTELMGLMSVIKRNDIEEKVMKHHKAFQDIPNQQFIRSLEKEIGSLEKEIKKWEESLRKFIEAEMESGSGSVSRFFL